MTSNPPLRPFSPFFSPFCYVSDFRFPTHLRYPTLGIPIFFISTFHGNTGHGHGAWGMENSGISSTCSGFLYPRTIFQHLSVFFFFSYIYTPFCLARGGLWRRGCERGHSRYEMGWRRYRLKRKPHHFCFSYCRKFEMRERMNECG